MNEKQGAILNDKNVKGIKIKILSLIIAIATAIISAFLLVGIYFSLVNYQKVLTVSSDYVEWQQQAQQMREASDYLTEQARSFAETGEREYVSQYFNETNETKRREKALEYIEKHFAESKTLAALNKAMKGSVELMDTEYLSMRLKAEAEHYDLSDFPQEVQNASLTVPDKYDYSAKSDAEKDALAREILFNDEYTNRKELITSETNNCIAELVKELKSRQSNAESNMHFAFTFEVIMILSFIGYSVFVIIITSRQVFGPIMRYIPIIESDSPIPVEGARELRILANTYNTMYNAHHQEANSLKFKTEHDALTGALNRRALDKLQIAANDGKVAFLIVDVDNFKQVNDTYGHLIGDKILKKVVSYLRLYLRSDDRIFRIGGDEFAVVMFGVDQQEKNGIKEKIDGINKNLSEEKSEGLPPISLSVGVAFGNVIDQNLISNADNALYKRKTSGKAGITFHE